MYIEEIMKYINKLERKEKLDNHDKHLIMANIIIEYRYHTIRFLESNEDQLFIFALRQSIFGRERRSHLLWISLIKYLENKDNIGKTLYVVIKNELEKFLLDEHPFIRYETHHVSDGTMHKKHIITADIYKNLNESEDSIESFGGVFLAPIRLIKGFFNAATRNPLDIARQKTLFKKLEIIHSPADKKEILNKIIEHFEQLSLTPKSKSSKELYQLLKSASDLSEKWYKMIKYIRQREGDYLKNNGKALFNCIEEILNNYHLAPEAKRIASL